MRACIVFIGLWLGFCTIVQPAFAQNNGQQQPLEEALANLRNSDAEWRRENKAYHRQRRSNAMSAKDAEEYAEFVAGLQRQKLEDCEAVRKIGDAAALKGFECLEPENKGPRSNVVVLPKSNAAETEGEKIDALEAKLRRLEAELDEELLRKQETIRQKAHNQPSNSGSGSWSAPDGPGTGGSQGATSQGSGQESAEDARARKAEGRAEPKQNGSTAGKGQSARRHEPGAGPGLEESKPAPRAAGAAEDGSDDDVVMRQVREAAEREKDPVLKKKLWDEYRKLKAARN